MKIALTSSGNTSDSPLDERFGRAATFAVYDTDTQQFEFHSNTRGVEASGGAGIQAAEAVSRLGASRLVTGHVGPKAFKALTSAGIEVYVCPGGLTVGKALEELLAGRLQPAASADVEGHWV